MTSLLEGGVNYMIHQEALCEKLVKQNKALKIIAKVISIIRDTNVCFISEVSEWRNSIIRDTNVSFMSEVSEWRNLS